MTQRLNKLKKQTKAEKITGVSNTEEKKNLPYNDTVHGHHYRLRWTVKHYSFDTIGLLLEETKNQTGPVSPVKIS